MWENPQKDSVVLKKKAPTDDCPSLMQYELNEQTRGSSFIGTLIMWVNGGHNIAVRLTVPIDGVIETQQ
jgi:hypothetical protein